MINTEQLKNDITILQTMIIKYEQYLPGGKDFCTLSSAERELKMMLRINEDSDNKTSKVRKERVEE